METTASALQPVRLSSNEFRIQGKSEILLCASLFYFRIPRAHWRERMVQLKAFGYNSIDVYFPWNYHELEEGVWDFSGEKDVTAFLQTAKEVGLWVVARPGPYICSEWDGGALPAYLYNVDGMKLRDNNPAFLNAVSKWFGRILPLLKKFQIDEDGTVICVQLDNELDFYGCADPKGYISALKDMATGNGITVPLIACAGQGGLMEASGLAEGVVPTCNFYPNDRDPVFEEKVLQYKELLADMGLPLLVTETNRSHFLLRRLLSCGVKLLGPYLQVSGTDFGFTNATNNWGSPLAFLTSDYDFGGMISPEGHIRPEAYEGRMLARMIETYGESLTEADTAPNIRAAAAPKGAVAGPYALKLRNGGYLVFVSNVGERAAEVSLEWGNTKAPVESKLVIERGRSLALPFGVPMQTWGVDGTLLYSTAELFLHKRCGSKTVLVFHTECEGEIALRLDNPTLLEATNVSVKQTEGVITVTFGSGETSVCRLETADGHGHAIELVAMDRTKALLIDDIGEDGSVRFGEPIEYRKEPADVPVSWSLHPVPADQPMSDGYAAAGVDTADYLETYGIYRGYAWYEAEARVNSDDRTAGRKGILVQKGSDIISLYLEKEYVTTVVPGGTGRYIAIGEERNGGSGRIAARVEIWGHTNFHDIRLPGLHLNAMKGLKGLVSVTDVIDLSRNWKVKSADDRDVRDDLTSPAADDRMWPIVGFGGWLSSDRPALEYYRNSFDASSAADSWTIHFEGTQALAHVFVNGQAAGASGECVGSLRRYQLVRQARHARAGNGVYRKAAGLAGRQARRIRRDGGQGLAHHTVSRGTAVGACGIGSSTGVGHRASLFDERGRNGLAVR
ncbi:beta-galactosidase [Paenibacillus thermotolerans]|uniref:beta-galactosidase n=1 Tax=Paenibacillus thermotolerans TaxID=3027807 RepID=UPI002368B143|nr:MULTISPECIES: beta-galactosidase [unclassified Paenibacillus]